MCEPIDIQSRPTQYKIDEKCQQPWTGSLHYEIRATVCYELSKHQRKLKTKGIYLVLGDNIARITFLKEKRIARVVLT